jgi:hypothetical protein
VVAQAAPVDLPLLGADADGSAPFHELLVVPLRELLARCLVRLVRLAAEHRRSALTGEREVYLGLGIRVFLERLTRVGHLHRVVEHDHLADVVDLQLLERRDHRPGEPGTDELVVVLDLRPAEHEADATVR